MVVDVKVNYSVCRKRFLLVLLFVVVLVVSLFVFYELTTNNNGDSGGVGKVSLEGAVYVGSEMELKTTIDNVVPNVASPTVVALNQDIILTETLVIPADKNITLTSNKLFGFFKLVGVDGDNTTIIKSGGVLRVAGVIITHNKGDRGRGVCVEREGTLILSYGKISDNTNNHQAGVINDGTFIMTGGEISNNNATGGKGRYGYIGGVTGGVSNSGDFIMSGGKITHNTAVTGGQASVYYGYGGGVTNFGNFTLTGGEISYNFAQSGGGVQNHASYDENSRKADGTFAILIKGVFTMTGGKIIHNVAVDGGGGVANGGIFIMTGGEITDNRSLFDTGGGVTSNNDDANVFDGKITNNKAPEHNNLRVVDENREVIISK